MKFGRDRWTTLVVILLIAAIPVFCIYEWARGPRQSAQFLTFPDGSKYRFAGVSIGTNHLAPVALQRVSSHLPGFLAGFIGKSFGKRFNFAGPERSPAPELHIWLEQVEGTGGFVNRRAEQAVLADDKGTEGSQRVFIQGAHPWLVARFGMVPRRSRMLELHFYPMLRGGVASGPEFGKIKFRNPWYGEYPQWKPETLPAKRLTGDVEVQLRLAWIGTLPGIPPATRFELQVSPATNSAAIWAVQRLQVSDATGNQLTKEFPGSATQRQFTMDGVFWPDEEALRLKVFLKRTSGFPGSELLTFTNVPFPRAFATSGTSLTNHFGGCSLVLRNFAANADYGMGLPSYQYSLDVLNSPDDLIIDFAKVEKDSGGDITNFIRRSRSGNQGLLLESLPKDAKSLNITVSVQKMRSVEFLVKPQ